MRRNVRRYTALIGRIGDDGFDFRDQLARDDDIRFEAVARFCALMRVLIEDGNCDLSGEGNVCICQFQAQAQLIYGFQQSGAGTSIANPITRSVNGSARSTTTSP